MLLSIVKASDFYSLSKNHGYTAYNNYFKGVLDENILKTTDSMIVFKNNVQVLKHNNKFYCLKLSINWSKCKIFLSSNMR